MHVAHTGTVYKTLAYKQPVRFVNLKIVASYLSYCKVKTKIMVRECEDVQDLAYD